MKFLFVEVENVRNVFCGGLHISCESRFLPQSCLGSFGFSSLKTVNFCADLQFPTSGHMELILGRVEKKCGITVSGKVFVFYNFDIKT